MICINFFCSLSFFVISIDSISLLMSGRAGIPLVFVVLLAAMAWIVFVLVHLLTHSFFRCNSEVLSHNPTEVCMCSDILSRIIL